MADSDLLDILDYGTTQFGDRVGTAYFLSFDTAFERLRRNPGIGTSVGSVRPDAFRLKHRRHGIFYQFSDDVVFVLRVLHHAQDVTSKL